MPCRSGFFTGEQVVISLLQVTSGLSPSLLLSCEPQITLDMTGLHFITQRFLIYSRIGSSEYVLVIRAKGIILKVPFIRKLLL